MDFNNRSTSSLYQALNKVETGLCYEMFEVIYEMFLDEVDAQRITRTLLILLFFYRYTSQGHLWHATA